jgi:Ca2+-binding EF-hand superfamily protein
VELEDALRELGQGFTREEVQVILESVDTDKSGEIEWLEFLEINRKFYKQKLIDFEKNFLDVGKEFTEFRPEDIRAFAAAYTPI